MSNVNQDAIDAIELALNTLGCNQKDLALQLNVSRRRTASGRVDGHGQ